MNLFLAPVQWDANEWFILATIVMGWIFVYKHRRLFPLPLLVLLLFASLMLALTLDLIFGAPPLDLYDINDTKYVEWFDMLLYADYPPFGFLFLYVYTRLRLRGGAALVYIIAFSSVSMGVELLADYAGVFKNKGWKYAYSFPVYLLAQSLYLMFYRWIRQVYFGTKLRGSER